MNALTQVTRATITGDQRREIRAMCGYILDDTKIARHYQVSAEQVAAIRHAIPLAKRRGKERTSYSHQASGIGANDVVSIDRMRAMEAQLSCEIMLRAMIETGHHWLKPDRLAAVCEEYGWKVPA